MTTTPMISQRCNAPAREVFASDMNWVRLEMRVNHKQSSPAGKADLRHFYVTELVDAKHGFLSVRSSLRNHV